MQVEPRQRPEVERLLNRELCWLDFNGRILELAADPKVPLLERVRFCSIFSRNLDEFFSVRVAGLIEQAASGLAVRSADGRTPQTTLREMRERVLGLMATQARLWKRDLRPELATQGIAVGQVEDLDEGELADLTTRFEHDIYPVLTPLAVGPGQPFPYISALSLSLAVFVRDAETGEERFARVKVPERLPRFLPVGDRGVFLRLEGVITHFLPRLFPQMEITECATFRVSRDADFELSDEADDLLEAVELELQRRRFGGVVRLEVSQSMSTNMLARLQQGLAVASEQVYPVDGPLALGDLEDLASLDRPELGFEPWLPVTPARLAAPAGGSDLFAEIRRGDILVHHPYDSFATSFEAFVREAAKDPDVLTIKTTVYRTSDDSPLVPALIEAAEDGKQCVCLVELKARFDERRNIEWSRALERAGVHVVYGFPTLKIHAKTTLVVRREADGLRRYVHIGTGNYHALTARVYEDFGLFTADSEIAQDVADFFNNVTGFGRPQQPRKLLVGPSTLRSGLVAQIRRVADAAQAGKATRIRIKLNNLTDETVIEELYLASQAGVPIDIVARSICALRPGVPGLSENIRARSVLGRFLEHSRVSIFEVEGVSSCFLGSADLMPRNLDNRLEILTPVEDPRLQAQIAATFDVLLGDNTSAWELDGDGSSQRLHPARDEKPRGTQDVLMARTLARAATQPARRRSP